MPVILMDVERHVTGLSFPPDEDISRIIGWAAVELFTENNRFPTILCSRTENPIAVKLILTSHCSATRGLLATDHVILNHGQVTWTTPELAPPSPNYHTTPTGGRFSSRQI
ncbi:hypothetical protein TNCV_3360471 [Trichonephila clavipes]|nr:hypothetical protein TNCV_3360471 [Trichonephila clavipes]